MKALKEFNQLSIKEKLAFDPSGRPGAAEVRERQAKIKLTISRLKEQSQFTVKYWRGSHETRLSCFLNRWRAATVEQALFAKRASEIADVGLMYTDMATRADNVGAGSWWVSGANVIILAESVSYDNNRYSKSYHRKYGGVRCVDDRRLIVVNKRNKKTVYLDRWGWPTIRAALAQAGVVKEKKGAPLKIRRNKYNDCKKVENGIYHITCAGLHVEYCAEYDGVLYHAFDAASAKTGAKNKAAASKIDNKTMSVSFDYCVQKLGFCKIGINDFCKTLGLDTNYSYNASQICGAVIAATGAEVSYLRDTYRTEIVTLAKALKSREILNAFSI